MKARQPASLRIGSLYTGLGGIDGAIMTAFDARLAWYGESTPRAAILAADWPGVPNLGDITTVDWAAVAPVGMVTAGWPPMDISPPGIAGLLQERRHAGRWRGIVRCLRQFRPGYAYLWNVAALNPRGRARVQADLARLGYRTQWAALRPCGIGGPPHQCGPLYILAKLPGIDGRLAAAARTTGPVITPPAGAGRRRPGAARISRPPLPACGPHGPGPSARHRPGPSRPVAPVAAHTAAHRRPDGRLRRAAACDIAIQPRKENQ